MNKEFAEGFAAGLRKAGEEPMRKKKPGGNGRGAPKGPTGKRRRKAPKHKARR